MPSVRKLGVVLVAAALLAALPSRAYCYEQAAVSDGGSITGRVVFRGEVPTRKIIPTKDLEVCGGPREDTLIDVGPDQGVKDAVVVVTDVAKGKSWPAAEKKPELDNNKCRFVPSIQVIPEGDIDVVNDDPILHNTHGYYGKRTAFNMALPNQGQRIGAELKRPGVVRVDCDAHGWMEGWIYVVDNPYYAITGANGQFTISDLPPGTYTVEIWQPYAQPIEQKMTVSAKQTATLNVELKTQ